MAVHLVQAARSGYRGLFQSLQIGMRTMSGAAPSYDFETLRVSQARDSVLHVELNRPKKRNAMNKTLWREMVECFNRITQDADHRVVVVSGAGNMFTAGIDLMDMAGDVLQPQGDDTARKAWHTRNTILQYQESFNVIEKCPKPVIAAVHSACIGGGVDLITACDIRLCSQDAWFQVKEVDIGMAADVGTLQRFPKVIGNASLVSELVYTARKMMADEALSCGLVSRVFEDKETMLEGAFEMASEIASKSPLAVQGAKLNLIYSRDHSVKDGLDYIATWNMSMLQTDDLVKSAQAAMEKKTPRDVPYSKL
ncbi:delta(3,5)-Delta(2,4)-dienoyl-CoA isomerase, mitochondrial isoform X1 [Carcharodon carcharias]|uniref:delta(3,5)-Delta(2,4)-dienoyl-CoA isomerase, mitochondrial isoform X1 n=2 Tax=Carcharodon carcharias TaxID=13397 RepID=UPI001B7E5ABE|nr:delta(3,5)-Delta(2,4)-dienoyl-CoA isomerase, mitochondrial isoform X1 [Carcharodon carcharias]